MLIAFDVQSQQFFEIRLSLINVRIKISPEFDPWDIIS